MTREEKEARNAFVLAAILELLPGYVRDSGAQFQVWTSPAQDVGLGVMALTADNVWITAYTQGPTPAREFPLYAAHHLTTTVAAKLRLAKPGVIHLDMLKMAEQVRSAA